MGTLTFSGPIASEKVSVPVSGVIAAEKVSVPVPKGETQPFWKRLAGSVRPGGQPRHPERTAGRRFSAIFRDPAGHAI